MTIGKFDGFHCGHKRLLERMKETGLPITVLIVSIPGSEELLTEEDTRMLAEHIGIERMIVLSLTEDIRNLSPEEFVSRILASQLSAAHVVIGENFRFGRDRAGEAEDMSALCGQHGIACDIVPMAEEDGSVVSSTRLRGLLSLGDLPELNRLLGYNYFVSGTIRHGREIGRTISFPTINLIPQETKLLPPIGVYMTETKIAGSVYASVTNIGDNPTVNRDGERRITVETHILDFSGDVYGETATVFFLRKMRDQQTFSSLAELTEQLKRDVEARRKA